MGGDILNFAVAMTTPTTEVIAPLAIIVIKKTPNKHNRKIQNNCTDLPLGSGMAFQLKPDVLSLYHREVAGDAAKGTIDNTQ